jgi:hypothetical protein
MKGNINELKTKIKTKMLKVRTEAQIIKKWYQTKINILKDNNGNLLSDPQRVLYRWKVFFNHVLNVHGVHDIRQMVIHTAELLAPEPSLVDVEIAFGSWNGVNPQILIRFRLKWSKQGVKHYILRHTNLYILSGISRNW